MSDPFDKLLVPKVEHVYNLQIDMITKQKRILLVKNVIQQTNQKK